VALHRILSLCWLFHRSSRSWIWRVSRWLL